MDPTKTHPSPLPLPSHLSGREAQGLIAGQPVAQFELGSYRNFVYLAVDWQQRTALWIDPAQDLKPILDALEKHSLRLLGIVLTHSHHDHLSGVPGLLERYPELPVFVHPDDQHRLNPIFHGNLKNAIEGDRITLSAESGLEVLHTPGHSAGELCLNYITQGESYLFTGDTLFIRDCGRTDLPTGNDAELFATLQRLKQLPPQTIILPGHHYTPECASRLTTELLTSPPLLCESVEALAAL